MVEGENPMILYLSVPFRVRDIFSTLEIPQPNQLPYFYPCSTLTYLGQGAGAIPLAENYVHGVGEQLAEHRATALGEVEDEGIRLPLVVAPLVQREVGLKELRLFG